MAKRKGKVKRGQIKRELAKEETLTRIAQSIRRGMTYSMIAEQERVTVGMVWKWVEELRRRWREVQESSVDDLIQEKVEQLTEIIKEARDAWERSKADTCKKTEEWSPALDQVEEEQEPKRKYKGKQRVPSVVGKGGELQPLPEHQMVLLKKMIVTEGRLPASEYLNIIKDCYKEICRLKGLYPAEKRDVTMQTLDWTALLETPQSIPDDSIDRALEGMIRELPEASEE